MTALRFAHPQFRAGQRELSEAVYRTALNGRCLIAQAPTGIGKTIGTLFPMLKAWPQRRLDKLFFLTAKTPGRALALDALAALRRGAPGLPLRVLELVARDKACEHPGKACHGESCPLARGFYDRLPAARAGRCNRPTGLTVQRCAPSRSNTRSVPITSGRNWCAGPMWWSATTTTISMPARCCTG